MPTLTELKNEWSEAVAAAGRVSDDKEAFDKADEALKAMQDENKGLLQQFAEKLGEVVKALLEFKAKLMESSRRARKPFNSSSTTRSASSAT